jgi:hypothetical protein
MLSQPPTVWRKETEGSNLLERSILHAFERSVVLPLSIKIVTKTSHSIKEKFLTD